MTEHINIATGELISIEKKGRRLPDNKLTRKIGVSIPYPYFCRSSSDLIECLSVLDPYFKPNANYGISSQNILQLSLQGFLSHNELKIFSYLAHSVTGWNITYISRTALAKQFSSSLRAGYKLIQQLENRKLIHNLYSNDVWLIHPFYVWKGDYARRDTFLMQWHPFQQHRSPHPVEQ